MNQDRIERVVRHELYEAARNAGLSGVEISEYSREIAGSICNAGDLTIMLSSHVERMMAQPSYLSSEVCVGAPDAYLQVLSVEDFYVRRQWLPKVGTPLLTLKKLPPQEQQQQQQQQVQRAPDGYFITRKLSNLTLNWRSIANSIPEMALTVGGALASSWMLILSGIVLLRNIHNQQSIRISESHANVLIVMMVKFGLGSPIDERQLQIAVSAFHKLQGVPNLAPREFTRVIDDLVRLRCVDLSVGYIKLLEKVNFDINCKEYLEKGYVGRGKMTADSRARFLEMGWAEEEAAILEHEDRMMVALWNDQNEISNWAYAEISRLQAGFSRNYFFDRRLPVDRADCLSELEKLGEPERWAVMKIRQLSC